MMKKLLFALLIASLSLSLLACNGKEDDKTTNGSDQSNVSSDQTETSPDITTPVDPVVSVTEYDTYGLGEFSSKVEDDNFIYKIYQNGVALVGYKGNGDEVTLPTEVNGNKITVLGEYVFGADSNATKVTIPSGYTTIARSAFYHAAALTAVEIPSSVTSIGDKAFAYSGVTSVTIPDSVTSLGKALFFGATSLTDCKLPGALTEIPAQTFYGCTSLNYTVPAGIKGIGDEAFYFCSAITNVKLPDSVETLGNYAFYYCTNVGSIEFAGNTLSSIGNYAFYGLNKVASLSIPSSVTSIGDYAFSGLSITEVTIPETVTTLGSGAFAHCTGLTTFALPNSITKIPAFILYGCENIASVSFSPDVTSIQNGAFGRTALTQFTVSPEVNNLGYSAFYKCTKLAKVELGDKVSNIMQSTFAGCTSLTEITIPKQVSTLGASAFEGCLNLSKVNILCENSTTFNNRAFYNCPSLKTLELSPNISTMNPQCVGFVESTPEYEGAEGTPVPLEGFVLRGYLGGRQETYAKNYATTLTEYKGSDTVITSFFKILGVAGYAPYDDFEFTLVDPPVQTPVAAGDGDATTSTPVGLIITKYKGNDEVVKLPTYFRLDENNEISLYGIDRRIVFIGEGAFEGNQTVTSVTVPESLEEIRKDAFRDCAKLTTIDLSATKLANIGENAFLNTKVYKFTLPATVKTIGDHALCYKLDANGTYSVLPTITDIVTSVVKETIDVTEVCTDEEGNIMYGGDSVTPVTQKVTEAVTDADGTPQTDEEGAQVTIVVTSQIDKTTETAVELSVGISGAKGSVVETYATGASIAFTAA